MEKESPSETKKRLLKYRDLKTTNPAAAYRFFLENEIDERFVSIVRFGDDFLQYLKEYASGGGDLENAEALRAYLNRRLEEQ